MNTYAEIEYIKSEYIKQGILDSNGQKIPSPTGFDYCIYPWEKGYIPKCTVCKSMTLNTKTNTVTAPHRRCGCLWFNWFKTKFLSVNPDIKFV